MKFRRIVYFVAIIAVVSACEVENVVFDEGQLPEPVRTAWNAQYPHKSVREWEIAAGADGDSVYTLSCSNAERPEDDWDIGFSPEFAYETRWVLAVTKSGTILSKWEEAVIDSTRFPGDALQGLREEFPGKELAGIKRTIVGDSIAYVAAIIMEPGDDTLRVQEFIFDTGGAELRRALTPYPNRSTLRLTITMENKKR